MEASRTSPVISMRVIASLVLIVAQMEWCEDKQHTLKLFHGRGTRRRQMREHSTLGRMQSSELL